jgi:photosystem II stability/assembly factor-like uncharacterized protein
MKYFGLYLLAFSVILNAQKAVVTPLGPEGGAVTVLTGSLNDEVVFASVQKKGVYRSADGGMSWLKVQSSALASDTIEIRDIVFHPQSSDTIFIPTTGGLFRSNDRGANFFAVASFPAPQLSIVYSPANPAVMFGSDHNGPLTSTDGGKSWKTLKDNVYFGNRYVGNIAVHPSDTGRSIRLIAATGFEDTVALFFSSNSGVSWRPMNKGLNNRDSRRIYKVQLDSMAIGKVNFRAVIGTADGIYGAQADRFDTAWNSLKSFSLPSAGVVTSGMMVYERWDPTAPPLDQHKFSLYYASNASEYDGTPRPFTEKNGIFKISSKNNSLFPTVLGEPPPVERVFAGLGDIQSVFIPTESNKSKIYLATTNGIFVSMDDGLTWERRNKGIGHTNIRSVVSLPSQSGSNILFAGVYGGGVMRSNDEGTSWAPVNNGLSSPYVSSLTADPNGNILYAGTAYSLYRSVDRGTSWTELFKVDSTVILYPSQFTNAHHEFTVRFSPVKSTNVLFKSSAFGMRVSTNGGGTWQKVVLPNAADSSGIPESIEFDPVDANTFYCAGRGLFKTTTLGQQWIDISSDLPKQGFNPFSQTFDDIVGLSPTINPKDPGEIFLSTTFVKGEGIPFRLFKTKNGGGSWDPLPVLIPSYDAVYDRLDPQRIVAGGPRGIYRTVNGGTSWSRITDSLSSVRYLLVSTHSRDNNIFYSGSEQGAYSISLPDFPKLAVDTSLYDFGSIRAGSDSMRHIVLKNLDGKRNVIVTFSSISDSVTFRYSGPAVIDIPAGSQVSVPVHFTPKIKGNMSAVLRLTSTDASLPVVQFDLRGHAFVRLPFEKFLVGFGSVRVGDDTTVTILIPNESRLPLSVALQNNSDAVNFSVASPSQFIVDTGKVGTLQLKFHPSSAGEHNSNLQFSTSDARFPQVQFFLGGVGVPKVFLSRNVVLDTTFGGRMNGADRIAERYTLLGRSLTEAGLNFQVKRPAGYYGTHSVVIIQPSIPIEGSAKDSLQRFVAAGGTLVLLADHRDSSAAIFNAFLRDKAWSDTYNASTGLQFGGAVVIDSVQSAAGDERMLISDAAFQHRYTFRAERILFDEGTYLTADTSLPNVRPLYLVNSPSLTVRIAGNMQKLSAPAITVAGSSVGKGRIIAVADPEIWWNGSPEDTAVSYGIFGRQNLTFALNLFSAVEDFAAELRETVEERYELISVPFATRDSSVMTLFKDLGAYSSYSWRMFGKYTRSAGYREFPQDFTEIRRGEGYWLITKEKKKVTFGSTPLSGVADDFNLTVGPGFTMIGNPFPYTVSWRNSAIPDSVEKILWSYNNGLYDTTKTTMEPFKGYWVFNRGKTAKNVRISSVPVSTSVLPKTGAESQHLLPDEWKVQLSLGSAKGSDAVNYIGVTRRALDGWDDDDFVKPPSAPTNSARLSLQNHGEHLAADFRSVNPDGHVWNLIVTGAAAGEQLNISARSMGELPAAFGLYIIDVKEERVFDLGSSGAYTFTMQKREMDRSFRLVAGTPQFLERNTGGIPVVPLEYSLLQNFPNPFNPETVIQYSLSNSGRVRLEIFNVLGQLVRTLVHQHQAIGAYSVTWDGKDNNGILLSSGIYYYQIQANTYRSVKKMTFIK